METFIWDVQSGAANDLNYQTNRIELGDGLISVTGLGINNEKQIWDITVLGDRRTQQDPAAQALKFLRERKGYRPFLWVTPYGETLSFIVNDLKDTNLRGFAWRLTARFEQFHVPGQ